MYDISQLNDLLVPELQDIAEQLHISNHKKLTRLDLIDKILETQSTMDTEKKPEGEKPKRKRIVKPASTEAAEPVVAARPKKTDTEKKPAKKQVEVEEETED